MGTWLGLTAGLLTMWTVARAPGQEPGGVLVEQPQVIACGDITALRTAIETANTTPGDHTITLSQGCTYTIADEYSDQEALPAFQKKSIIIEGNGATIRRAEGELRFRLINVAAAGRLIIRGLTVSNGWARTAAGVGAIRVDGDLFVTGSRVSGNHAGGIVVAETGQASFVDSFIGDNTQAGVFGAGINNAGDLYLENATVSGNRIPALPGQASAGGGLYNSGSAIVFKSSVTGNRARGGAGIDNTGELLVLQSAISGNDTNTFVPGQNTGGGSAILSRGILEVVNSTIANNRSLWRGGAVVVTAGTATFLHTTIAHNSTSGTAAEGAVGGISNLDDMGIIEIENSILANNVPSNCVGALIDRGYVLTDGVSGGCPGTFLTGDPKLSGFHWLVPGVGSAALDRIEPGDPAAGTGDACLPVDQRGMPRPGGAACDIGAYENQAPSTPGPIFPTRSPNQGEFALSWGEVTDPDDETVTYHLERRAATEQSWARVRNTAAALVMFDPTAPEREGRLYYRVAASDDRLSSAGFGESDEVVVDRTPPAAPAAAISRAPEYTDPVAGLPWFADAVTVSFTPREDPPLADGSPGSGIVLTTGPQAFASTGRHVATGSSTDAAGNASINAEYAVHVDADPPVVAFQSCPAEVLLGAIAPISWSATDAGSGIAGPTSGTIGLTTSPIGSRTSIHSVSDNVGHSSVATCTYNVIWDFRGFRAPLRAHPSLTSIAAASLVNVVFSLDGDQGLDVFAPGYPASAPIVCSSSDLLDAGEPAVTPGPLAFQASTGQYTYKWDSRPEWRGTCRQLIVKLRDGTFHRANVEFK